MYNSPNGKEQNQGYTLNPNARPWIPWREQGFEEERTIYITFSRGSPITKKQIYSYFTW